MKPTNIKDPEYFHKVIDCQHACPAHTPVPEYIRLIAQGRYTDAYQVNWESNVFPGILGRTCDRPCEPACRRDRLEDEEKSVAICRLKRVAADNKEDFTDRLPSIPTEKNGKNIAFIGAGPANLTAIRDLMPLGYECVLFDNQKYGGGMMRTQIPSFRLPVETLNEEVGYIVNMGVECHFDNWITSMADIVNQGFDAICVGTGAPKGRDLKLPNRDKADKNIHLGVDWLSSVAFEHTKSIGRKVIVLGGGNTAMDCGRTARRLGGVNVSIVVRSPMKDMKASEWEKDDALAEDIPILENHTPKEYVTKDGKLIGMMFETVNALYDESGKRSLIPTGDDDVFIECDDVLIAIGQDNAFPWIERNIGIDFNDWSLPVLNKVTFQSTLPQVFFAGDAAFGPDNIIGCVAHGHQVAISIDKFSQGQNISDRLAPHVTLLSQKMGVHEWLYDNDISNDDRFLVPHANKSETLTDIKKEVELGFDTDQAYAEAMRCLNCDIQTVFNEATCIECDACMDICPIDAISFTDNKDDEQDLRLNLTAPALNTEQDLYVSAPLATSRIMVKDEDVCLHCGLCAERCPTAAWDMQKFKYSVTKAHDKTGS